MTIAEWARVAALTGISMAAPGQAWATVDDATTTAVATCLPALDAIEPRGIVPAKLLKAIATVESGRLSSTTKQVMPWAWTIGVHGVGYFFDSQAKAVEAAKTFLALGNTSIDVGCMQINLAYHPTAFTTLEQAFDPQTNVAYAARFLQSLYHQKGDWTQAAAAYHSQTPGIAEEYQRKVTLLWTGSPSTTTVAGPAHGMEMPNANHLPGFSRWLRQNNRDISDLVGGGAPIALAARSRLGATGRTCFICQGETTVTLR